MTRQLHEIDNVYRKFSPAANVDERIRYCHALIHKTKESVASRRQFLTEKIISRSSEIINSAEMEILRLNKHLDKSKNNLK